MGISHANRGRFGYYQTLPATNDALEFVLLNDAGSESEDTLDSYATLSTLLVNNDECTAVNYSRQRLTAAGITTTVDQTLNEFRTQLTNLLWINLGNGSSVAVGWLVVCYNPDIITPSDANIRTIGVLRFLVAPDGTSVSALWDPDAMYVSRS